MFDFLLFVFFFFFKQKTAYEIRKGDWSSDVCSSDLASALKAVYSASPADFDLPRAANAAKASPAMIPIEPPNAAEIAPCSPASQAESDVAAAVHSTCSPMIGRKMRHTLHPAAAKPRNFKGKPTDPSNRCEAKLRAARARTVLISGRSATRAECPSRARRACP